MGERENIRKCWPTFARSRSPERDAEKAHIQQLIFAPPARSPSSMRFLSCARSRSRSPRRITPFRPTNGPRFDGPGHLDGARRAAAKRCAMRRAPTRGLAGALERPSTAKIHVCVRQTSLCRLVLVLVLVFVFLLVFLLVFVLVLVFVAGTHFSFASPPARPPRL